MTNEQITTLSGKIKALAAADEAVQQAEATLDQAKKARDKVAATVGKLRKDYGVVDPSARPAGPQAVTLDAPATPTTK